MLLFYVVGALGAIAAAALWSAHRERRFGPTPSEDRIFRCERCGYVYTDDPDVDRARCSHRKMRSSLGVGPKRRSRCADHNAAATIAPNAPTT